MSDLLLPEGARDGIAATEQVEQLNAQGLSRGSTPGVVLQPMPCTIYLVNGKQFVVPEVEGWGYVDIGVFATGHFSKAPNHELNVLFPYDRIDYYIMDFDALERYIQMQKQEAENGEDGSCVGPADEAQPESLGEGDSDELREDSEGS